MDIDQRYLQLLEAIEEERKQEESFFSAISLSKSIKEKNEEGFAWYPVEITATYYAAGDQLEVKIRRKNPGPNDIFHKFKVGVAVQLFNSMSDIQPVRGIVSYIQKENLSFLTNADRETLDEFQKGITGIEIMYDEKPYLLMKSALQKVIQSTLPSVRILKKALAEKKLEDNTLANFPDPIPETLVRMNDSQKKAILTAMQSRYLSIIHGPPGTGKTSTLVALCKALLQNEKRILVCASSNNAVDLLATRLHAEGLNVLRVGNITRIHDSLADLTLVEKMRSHADWPTIKKMRMQADQLSRQASQFKRNFTNEDRENRKAIQKEVREIRQWSRNLEDRISDDIINKSQVIATTLISAGHPLVENLRFQTVVIDEASQALEPECWNAILKAERVMLAGDHQQLPPTVKSNAAREKGLETTMLDVMTNVISATSLLTVQYRMHRAILGFSNENFYGGKLISSPGVENRMLPGDDKPIVFIDTAGCGFEEMFNPKQKSYKNEGEYFIMREFVLQKKELFLGAMIGIISPYAEQIRYISDEIAADPEWTGLDVEVNTIDGFQGQEKDIIMVSLVRSNEKSEIGFLKDARRLNVALTRARQKLVIFGDSATVGVYDLFEKLLTYVEINKGLDSAWNYMKYD